MTKTLAILTAVLAPLSFATVPSAVAGDCSAQLNDDNRDRCQSGR